MSFRWPCLIKSFGIVFFFVLCNFYNMNSGILLNIAETKETDWFLYNAAAHVKVNMIK